MTTQWERDSIARGKSNARLLALVEAAHAALASVEDPDSADDLREALKPYDLKQLRDGAAYYNREEARRRAEEQAVADSLRLFDELPDAPPRMQCHAQVARDMGRWTQFGRCEKPATRVVLDREARRERVVCTIHAKEWATVRSIKDHGWYDHPNNLRGHIGNPGNSRETHESWYRGQKWCMVKSGNDYCKVRVDIGSGKHEGKEHKF